MLGHMASLPRSAGGLLPVPTAADPAPPPLAARGVSAGAQAVPTLVKTEVVDGVAVVTLLSPDSKFPWGTRVQEHRINPLLIEQLNAALDAAEQEAVQAVVVVGEGKFFSNGMDLQYIQQHVGESTRIQAEAERLLLRLLTFRTPTVAAINGHFAAAGAMLGLAFDARVMASDGRGLMFVPGIDIGLVYSPGMTELMKAKLPQQLWNECLCFGRRFACADLHQHGVVNAAPPASELLAKAMEVAQGLKSKGKDQKTRDTLHGIKRNLYREAGRELGKDVQDMGFASGTWNSSGRASKL